MSRYHQFVRVKPRLSAVAIQHFTVILQQLSLQSYLFRKANNSSETTGILVDELTKTKIVETCLRSVNERALRICTQRTMHCCTYFYVLYVLLRTVRT